MLEICPTSNLNTRVVSGWDEFRWIFDTFRRNEIRFTINTDGPEMLKTYIRDEMAQLGRLGILSLEDQQVAAATSLASSARELHYWQQRRASAQLVPSPSDRETVHFGSTVTIERDDGRRQTWRIVGEDEADPTHGTLSYASPVARALAGRKVGEVVQAGNSEAEIVAIE